MSTEVYVPRIYDLFHSEEAEDARFYRDLALASGGPVLEVGVGTGRIALPIARSGVEIVGVDVAPEMLGHLAARLEQEAPEVRERLILVEADMRDFDLGRRFPLVTIPFRAFLHNLTRAEQVAAARCCRAHLAPGGELVLNVFRPSLRYMAASQSERSATWRVSEERDLGGGRFGLLSTASSFEPEHQQLRSWLRYEIYGADGVLEEAAMHRIRLAYLYPGDLRDVLGEAGFTEVHIAGGFDGRPLSGDADEQVVRAR